MLRHTGSGKVSTDPKYNGPGMLRASLHNFDIEGDAPKAEHLNFLKSKVIPLLSNNRGRIWLQGSASHSGGTSFNLALSRRRVRKIAEVLKLGGVAESQMQLDAVGEEMSLHGLREDEADRAVALVILPRAKNDPPPPVEPPKVNTRFKIRMNGGLTASAVGAGDLLIFQIWDEDHGVCSFYTFLGAGVSGGVIPKLWLSATMSGPWNEFRTRSPLGVNQFGGPARFSTAGFGSRTFNYLNMMGMPPHNSTLPAVLPLQTGFTVGIGAGTTVGHLSLEKVGEPDGVLPCTKP